MNATAAKESAAPAQGATPVQDGTPPKNQRKLVGRVTSNKMQKTVVVRIERRVRDPMMGKTLTRSRKYHAHVESGEFSEGDLVEIAECRPISKTKSWRVTRLVEKSKAV
jgi:small subunit ribosomal protein S17